tara:strand:- start:105 stop:686 length:582 start_codon:yes stop_codon:yes gene_type:complete
MDYQKGNKDKGHHESAVSVHKKDHDSVPNPLVQLDPGLFIWTIITFIILFSVLAKFAWKPLLKALEKRENDIRSSIEDAEKAKVELENVNSKSEAILAEARSNAQEIRMDAKNTAEKIKMDIKSKAEDEAKKIKEDASEQIQVEKEKAISEIRQEIVSLTILVAEKVIGKNLSAKDNQNLIKRSLRDLREYEA